MKNLLKSVGMRWKKSFLEFIQRIQQESPKKNKSNLLGYAVLRKDEFTGKKFWQTYDESGYNEVTFSAGQALAFPPEEMQVGIKIELFAPEE